MSYGVIIDGKAIAEEIYGEFSDFFLSHKAKLGIVVVGENPVITSFVRIKERAAQRLGVEMVRRDLPETASGAEVISTLREMAAETDAVIPQLPIPGLDIENILAAVPMEKDVDALNPAISEYRRLVHAPVALAVIEILKRSNVEI